MALRNAISLIATFLLSLVSCAKAPVAVRPARINPEAATDRMLEKYDADRGGSISQTEAVACCGLAPHFDLYDANQDGEATRDEIVARFRKWMTDDIGIMRVGCRVTLDGKPLSGGDVVLEPHPFLGEALQQAHGTTNEHGQCSLSIAPGDLPAELQRVRGVQPGLYLVRVTHPQIDVPTQFNTETIVGLEVAGDAIGPDGVEFALNTR